MSSVERLGLKFLHRLDPELSHGIALRPLDIDVTLLYGYGFPRWRGGLIHYADTLGAGRILAELQELASQGGTAARTPDPVIEDCARRGIPLSEWRR